MPDHDYPTPADAFDPAYLDQLAQHDDPVTAGEAVTGGFWRRSSALPRWPRRRPAAPRQSGADGGAEPRRRPGALAPASIASFLEAAGAAALELAGKILVRRS